MEVTDRLFIRCIGRKGARLLTFSLEKCPDGCCYSREGTGDEQYWFGDKLEVSVSFHTRSGIDFNEFVLNKSVWQILEIPEGYTVTEDGYGYTLTN